MKLEREINEKLRREKEKVILYVKILHLLVITEISAEVG
jgi:hypothetical protein